MKTSWALVGGLMSLMLLASGCQAKKSNSATSSSTQAASSQPVKPKKQSQAKPWHQYQKNVNIPILMYHSISQGNSLRVPGTEFEQQMNYLHKHHYYTLTTAEAIRAFKTNQLPQKKVVWVTMDDAYKDNYTKALPIIKKYHIKTTINYITSFAKHHNHLTLKQVQKMRQTHLVEFQSHTVKHLDLNELTDQQQEKELTDSKRWLDQKLHQDTQLVCYPADRVNNATARLAKKAGYKIGITTEPGMANVKQQGWYNLKRQRVVPNMTTAAFATLLQNN